ncbi:MAG: hypothetical protein ACYC26_03735 [Phycisphaerales bacterium]
MNHGAEKHLVLAPGPQSGSQRVAQVAFEHAVDRFGLRPLTVAAMIGAMGKASER